MISLSIRVMNKYKTLVKKIIDSEGQDELKYTKRSFHHLINALIVVSLSCLISTLKSLHQLIQLDQKWDVYICDYLDALKQCKANITAFHIIDRTKFQHDVFWNFAIFQRLSSMFSTCRADSILVIEKHLFFLHKHSSCSPTSLLQLVHLLFWQD